MAAGGMVRGITDIFVGMIRNRVSLVGATVGTGLTLNLAVADQYICILLNGNMFKQIYPNFNANRPILFCLSRSCVLKKSAWVLQIFGWRIGGMNVITSEGHRVVRKGAV